MIQVGVGDTSCRNISDPINLLFRGVVSRQDIETALRGASWIQLSQGRWLNFGSGGHFASSLYLCDEAQHNPEREHFQLVNGDPWDRYHVRLWEVAQLISKYGPNYHHEIVSSCFIAGAHHEVLTFTGHRVTSFEAGKWKTAYDLHAFSSGWQINHNVVFTGNFQVNPFSNEFATEIRV